MSKRHLDKPNPCPHDDGVGGDERINNYLGTVTNQQRRWPGVV